MKKCIEVYNVSLRQLKYSKLDETVNKLIERIQ